MAKFCKYCGKPLDHGVCDCPQAVSEVDERARAQVMAAMSAHTEEKSQQVQEPTPAPAFEQAEQTFKQAGEAFQKTAQNIQQSQQAKQAAQIMEKVKNLLVSFVKHPVAAMQTAAQESDKTPQYMVAAVFVVVTLICGCIMMRDDMFEGARFKMSLVAALAVLIVRLVYAVGIGMMVKKQNPSSSLKSAIGVFSITLFADAAIILLIMITLFISLYELTMALVVFWMVVNVILAFLATWVLNGGRMEHAVRVSLILQLILMIILVFAARGLLVASVKSTTNSMMRALGF